MTKMSYNFQTQLNDPRQKEANRFCYEFLQKQGYEVKDVSEDENYYKIGADLIIKHLDSQELIDVKCDFQTHITGNIAIEFIEIVRPSKENWKLGWMYNKVNKIYYVIWETKELILLDKEKLKKLCFEKPQKGFASHHDKQNYYTFGLLLDLKEIKKQFQVIQL